MVIRGLKPVLSAGLVCLSAAVSVAQVTWYVDDDTCPQPGDGSQSAPFCSIQAALDVASNGDEIIVAGGSYHETIDFLGKGLTLQSSDGAESTILDATGLMDSAVKCVSGEGPSAILRGFTVTGGLAPRGGGMLNEFSDPTVIDCTFLANAAESPPFVIAQGGGMHNYFSDPTVEGCVFQANTAWGSAFAISQGGGMYNEESAPTVTDCRFIDNVVLLSLETYTQGAGMCNFNSSPTVSNCEFVANQTGGSSYGNEGGGMFNENSSPTVTDSVFRANFDLYGVQFGAGMSNVFGSHPIVSDCTFVENLGGHGTGMDNFAGSNPTIQACDFIGNKGTSGAGMDNIDDSNPVVRDCSFSGNVSQSRGGAIHNNDSNPEVSGCLFVNNRAASSGLWTGGGAIANEYDSHPLVSNCSFTANSAGATGGAVFNFNNGGPTIVHCTFQGNTAGVAGAVMYSTNTPLFTSAASLANCILWKNGPVPVFDDLNAATTISFSDVEGGWAGGGGNIDADPLLASPADNHLISGSPCIDVGTNDPPGGLPTGDLDGNPRSLDGDGNGTVFADMGAFEFNLLAPSIAVSKQAVIFNVPEGDSDPVEQSLSIRNCGGEILTWELVGECPWLEIIPTSGESTGEMDQVTLRANAGALAHGDYSCLLAIQADGAVNSPRNFPVELRVNLTLQVPDQHPTIQVAIDAATVAGDTVVVADGVYAGPGNKSLSYGGKDITVRSASGPSSCIIDLEQDGTGFHFMSGELPGAVLDGFSILNAYAFGILCENGSSPTIMNCVIRGASPPGQVAACGIASTGSSPTITGCTIRNYSSGGSGGGIYCSDSSLTITDCLVTGNVFETYGGGINSFSNSNLRITDSTISGNSSGIGPGGIHLKNNSYAVIDGCTITGNAGAGVPGSLNDFPGAGITCSEDSVATISRCIIAGNTAGPTGGGGIGCEDGALTVLGNCLISGNSTDVHGGAVRCEDGSDTYISHSTIDGSAAGTEGGALSAAGATTTVNIKNCVLWDDQAFDGPEIAVGDSSTVMVEYSDVQGGQSAAHVEGDGDLIWSIGVIDSDPKFTPGFAGTWTAEGQFDAQTLQIALTDNGADWVQDELIGRLVAPDTAQGLAFVIVSNTATTITVRADWTSIQAGASWVSAGMNYEVRDYHLTTNSPCVEAGDPTFALDTGATDFDNQPRLMGCRTEMGFDERTAGEPRSGDMDASGALDISDIPFFVIALLGQGTVTDECVADVNGDDSVDGGDVQVFVAVLMFP